ncbi:MAG: flagellar hook protein FlgE [Deltaproteobacteria bacterium]|nr:flagellar hook protein FlgE [Deltaproteobacteria bacterium]
MSLFNGLFAGVNGINANGVAISTLGDNIANVNTVGYKSSRASFEDILAGSQGGLGSRVAGVNQQFGQGGFESTSSTTDLAIDGSGFFVVKNATDGSTYYSRAGQFNVNSDGYLVNPNGERLQGYLTNSSNAITAQVGDIQVATTPVPPSKTASVTVVSNLSSNDAAAATFDPLNPTATSNFSTGVTVYDSLGNSRLVSVYFRKASTNNWEWYALADGGDLTSGTPGVNQIGEHGTLVYGTSGALSTTTFVTGSSSQFNFLGATQNQVINFNFGSSTSTGGTGLDGVTQFGSSSVLTNLTQDGYASGSLKSIDITKDGTITGTFTNGASHTLAQVATATFGNEEGLKRVGSNNFQATSDSGAAIVNAPAAGGRGGIVSSSLEQSNVDIASELIKMVVFQRGFSANSRTISAINEMLGELVQLGR